MRDVRPRRTGAFVLLSGGALAAAVVGARLTGGDSGSVTLGVEALSSSSSMLLDRFATVLPLGFAFGAGMVSAANPCGFAMVPAFLALFLRGSPGEAQGAAARVGRGLTVGAVVTAGFLLLFGVAGLAIAAGARWLAGAFPWLGLATGVLLVLTGSWLAVGGTVHASLGQRLASPVARAAGGDGVRAYFAYGVAYGVASLSCTLPVFLAVVGSTLTLPRLPDAILQIVLYGLGMGTVITLLSVSLAAFQGALVARVRRVVPSMAMIGAALLLIAGSYIVYYWLTVGGLAARVVVAG